MQRNSSIFRDRPGTHCGSSLDCCMNTMPLPSYFTGSFAFLPLPLNLLIFCPVLFALLPLWLAPVQQLVTRSMEAINAPFLCLNCFFLNLILNDMTVFWFLFFFFTSFNDFTMSFSMVKSNWILLPWMNWEINISILSLKIVTLNLYLLV